MDIGKTLFITDRQQWRKWLVKNHSKEKEIWLIFPMKATGKPRIAYNDAVEEALCFGWIDSLVKKVNISATAQRFSPRNPRTKYSQANKERLKRLVKEDKVIPSVKITLEEMLSEEFIIPSDILLAVKSNELAWRNFQNFSPAYQRIRVAFIDEARKRPDEFEKRLAYFIKMSEKNKKIGYGGIEKYF